VQRVHGVKLETEVQIVGEPAADNISASALVRSDVGVNGGRH